MSDTVSGLFIFFVAILIIKPLFKLLRWIWELSITLCKTNPVNLKEKFGDWAGIWVIYLFIYPIFHEDN